MRKVWLRAWTKWKTNILLNWFHQQHQTLCCYYTLRYYFNIKSKQQSTEERRSRKQKKKLENHYVWKRIQRFKITLIWFLSFFQRISQFKMEQLSVLIFERFCNIFFFCSLFSVLLVHNQCQSAGEPLNVSSFRCVLSSERNVWTWIAYEATKSWPACRRFVSTHLSKTKHVNVSRRSRRRWPTVGLPPNHRPAGALQDIGKPTLYGQMVSIRFSGVTSQQRLWPKLSTTFT